MERFPITPNFHLGARKRRINLSLSPGVQLQNIPSWYNRFNNLHDGRGSVATLILIQRGADNQRYESSSNKSFFRLVQCIDMDLPLSMRITAVQEVDHVWRVTAQLLVEALFSYHVLIDAFFAFCNLCSRPGYRISLRLYVPAKT